MILPEQIRAARALLNWEQKILAERAGLGIATIKRLKDSARGPVGGTAKLCRAVQRALEHAGIIFIEGDDRAGPGVRLATPTRGRAVSEQKVTDRSPAAPQTRGPSR